MAQDDVACLKKKAREQGGWIVFQDESDVSQKPPLRRTWAPKGQTPVVVHAFNWKRLSICAATAYRWDGKRSRLYFQTIAGNYDSESLIRFLKDLKGHFRGKNVILVWDGLPAHRSAEMKAFLEAQSDWLEVERLPGYAPDLNPVEDVWENIKGQELANQSANGLGEIATATRAGLERVKSNQDLLFCFLHHTGHFF